MVGSNHIVNPHDDEYRHSIKEFNANTLTRKTDALIMVYALFFKIFDHQKPKSVLFDNVSFKCIFKLNQSKDR